MNLSRGLDLFIIIIQNHRTELPNFATGFCGLAFLRFYGKGGVFFGGNCISESSRESVESFEAPAD